MSVNVFIFPEEQLGRVLSNPEHRLTLSQGRIPSNAFYHRCNTEVSAQRLYCCPLSESVRQARLAIGPSRPFLGWAVVRARDASVDGGSVRATPTDLNPCHADIVFPPCATEKKANLRYAQELARKAHWKRPPAGEAG